MNAPLSPTNPIDIAEQLRAMRRRAILVYRATPSGPVYGIHGTVVDLGILTDAADLLEQQHLSAQADVAPAPAGEPVAWADADAICNAPDVDEAIRTLLDDQTGDNAVEVVRAILRYAQPAAARVPQDQRAAFEAWVKVDSTLPVDRDCFDYKDFTVALLWHAWQAAQKANAPGGALVGDDDANGRPGLAGADSTCRHEFALQPSSGIKLCTHCGLSEVAARKTAAARVPDVLPTERIAVGRLLLGDEAGAWEHSELDELRDLNDKMGCILSRTAVALRGPEPTHMRWSWHDLPDRAAAAIAAIDVMQRAAVHAAAARGPLTSELLREVTSDAQMVFQAGGADTLQIVRDVIEYFSESLKVHIDRAEAASQEGGAA